jgi:hypothetical protein
MLSVTYKPFMLSVIMLSVIMLSVVAPLKVHLFAKILMTFTPKRTALYLPWPPWVTQYCLCLIAQGKYYLFLT